MAFCENCGSEIKEGQKFCENCGAEVKEVEVMEVPYADLGTKEIEDENHFCENCGAALEPGAEFCESCGAKVPKNRKKSNKKSGDGDSPKVDENCLTLFNELNWKDLWFEAVKKAHEENYEVGIIFTDLDDLCCTNPTEEENEILERIQYYIETAREKNNVQYYLLNKSEDANKIFMVDPTEVDDILELLEDVVNVARPKYLFILGGVETVPRISWENACFDGDSDLQSDLVYSTLDCNSPFEGQNYNFDNVLRVGRLPNIPDYYFSELLGDYDIRVGEEIDEIKPLGVTALQWEDTSRHVFGRFAESQAMNSPDFNCDSFNERIGGDETLLYFNVHGSDDTRYWYGQDGGNYPEASEPASFDSFFNPFILGVEACYGGKFASEVDSEESTVYRAFQYNCVSMLASTYIAYGTPSGPGASADILIGRYLHDMKEGYSAGDAYINGLKELRETEDVMNDMAVKTMVEFALYGDPSYRRSKDIEKKNFSLKKAFGGVAKGLKVPLPDVRRAVSMSLTEVDAKIADPIKNHVVGKYAGFEESNPIFYKYDNSKYTQATFQKSTNFGDSYVKVCFDDKGKIVRELVSK